MTQPLNIRRHSDGCIDFDFYRRRATRRRRFARRLVIGRGLSFVRQVAKAIVSAIASPMIGRLREHGGPRLTARASVAAVVRPPSPQ
jgi:hypothetical protein